MFHYQCCGPRSLCLIMCPFLSQMCEDERRDEKCIERGICWTREEAWGRSGKNAPFLVFTAVTRLWCDVLFCSALLCELCLPSHKGHHKSPYFSKIISFFYLFFLVLSSFTERLLYFIQGLLRVCNCFCLFFTALRRKNGEHYCMPKRCVFYFVIIIVVII